MVGEKERERESERAREGEKKKNDRKEKLNIFKLQLRRTPSMAAAAFGQVEDFCANNIVYGTEQLCKSVGETDCVIA